MDSNITLSLHHCNAYFARNLTFTTVLISVFLCFGVIGNVLVLFLYKYRMPQTEERFFIPYLAVADLMSTVSLAWLGITTNFYFTDFPNEDLCKFLPYFSWVTTSWSAFILLLISVSRYLKICRPTGRQMTRFLKKCAVYGCFAFAVVNTSPLLYFAGFRYSNVSCLNTNMTIVICDLQDFDKTVNNIKDAYMFIEFCIIFLIAIITAALYVPIGLQIFKRFKRKSSNGFTGPKNYTPTSAERETEFARTELTGLSADSEDDLSRDMSKSENIEMTEKSNEDKPPSARTTAQKHKPYSKYDRNIKVRNNFTYMFITIIVFYVLSYLPTFILILLAADEPFYFWYSMDINVLNILMTLRRSSVINHIVNPFIYGYFDQVFRKCVVHCFTRK